MADTRTAGRLQDMAREFAAALEAGDVQAAAAMLDVWEGAFRRTMAELKRLTDFVVKARRLGVEIDEAWVVKLNRLDALLDTAGDQLRRYAALAADQITAAQQAAVDRAVLDSLALLAQGTQAVPSVVASLASINPGTVATLVGFMGDGTPLAQHLARTVADDAVAGMRDLLVQALTKGWHPTRTAREFARAFALSHTRAVTIARTETLRVYRETSRQTYEANPDVCQSWTWYADLGPRCCPACAVMHGTHHPTTETLDGHPRCRCVMLPDVSFRRLGFDIPDPAPIPPGTDWIDAMPPTQLAAYLGPGKAKALGAGQITLADLVARKVDPDWGSMRTERSLVSILSGRNANFGGLAGYLG